MTVTSTRLSAVLVTIGLLTLAVCGMRLSEAGPDAQLIRGEFGRAAVVREGTVLVQRVQVGTSVTQFGRTSRTAGMFVLISVEGTAPGRDRLRLSRASLLTDDDVTYRPFALTSGVTVEPGFAVATDLVFEVDPARIDELTLELQPTEIVSGYQQHVRVHLGITADNAAGWVAAARDRELEIGVDVRRGLT